jgi:hypothetical protein
MAKPVATLLIEMAADVARLRQDMNQAKGLVDSSFASMKSAAGTVKTAFAAIGVSLSVGALTSWVKSAINAADESSKLAQKIGVATEEVAGLQLAFNLAGAGGNLMQTSLAKLANEADKNNSAFQRLGVQTRNTDGSLRSTSQILRDVSDRFANMDDGAQKTALAINLFGRAGAELIPLLNGGSKGLDEMDEMARKLGLTISTETGKQAELFNDTLELVQTGLKGIATRVAAEMLPSLTNLASAFLGAMTEGDRLKNIADILSFAIKSLFTVFIGLIEVVNTVITAFGALGSAFMAIARGDFAAARDIVLDAGKKIGDGWKNAQEVVSKAWSDTADSSITNAALIVGSSNRTVIASDEEIKAAKKRQEEYAKLTSSIDKQIAMVNAEVQAGGKLTEAHKLEIDIRQKLTSGTLILTAAEQKEVEAKLAAYAAALKDRDAQKASDDARKALTQTLGKEIEEIEKQLAAQRKSNEEAGLSREQIARLEIQRLRDAAAIAQRNAQLRIESGINDDITEQYQKQSEGLQKLADEKEKGIHVESAKQAATEWQKTTESIYNGLTDALMRAFESGKGFMEAFKQTLKNAFKTLVLEPTIRAIMGPISGAIGGLFGGSPAGAATGGGGGGGGGLLGNIGSIAGIGGMVGSGLGYGLAAYSAGGLGLLGTLSGAGSMISGGIAAGSLGSIAAGIGGVLGALGPIALGIGLLIKGFSRGPKQTTGTGIEGGFLGGDFEGQQYSEWIKKGGWFRSSKRGTDYNPLAQDLKAQFDEAGAALFAGATEYGKVLGLPIDALKDVNYRVRVALTEDEKANAEAIEKALEGYRNSLAGAFTELLEPFQKSGEALADTLERLALLQGFSQDINVLGGIFSRVATLSVSAKEQLLEFSGGMEAFVRQAQGFVANYYSESERFGIAASRIREQLSALGITGDVSTRADFRKLIESTDISTEEGRRQLAALLALSEQFAQVGSYLEQQGITLDELAEAAPQVEILKSILDDAEIQTKAAQRTADATERLFDGVTDMGKLIAAAVAGSTEAIRRLQEIMESGQAAIVQATRENTRILDSWDNNGSIATTPGEP